MEAVARPHAAHLGLESDEQVRPVPRPTSSTPAVDAPGG